MLEQMRAEGGKVQKYVDMAKDKNAKFKFRFKLKWGSKIQGPDSPKPNLYSSTPRGIIGPRMSYPLKDDFRRELEKHGASF